MSDDGWSPWTLTALGLALIMVTALVTGLVVANWAGPAPLATLPAPIPDGVWVSVPAAGGALAPSAMPLASGELVPPQAIVAACNEYAVKHVEQRGGTSWVAYRDAYAICLRARGYRDDRAP